MKWLRRAGLAFLFVLFLPILLIAVLIMYEIFGMCVNHMATGRQTGRLQKNLENTIPDIAIVRVYSETGNTSGTGNHVDCLSSVSFSTEMTEDEIIDRMSEIYDPGGWDISKTEEGYYLFCIITPAPFADNIEGH